MKKIVFSLAISLFFCATLMAQSVTETETTVGDKRMPAYSITLNKGDKLVGNAISQRMKNAGLKTKKASGYVASLNSVFSEIAETPVDFYTKVEGNKDESVLTVCAVSSDYKTDQSLINAAVRHFVDGFPKYLEQYEATEMLSTREKELKSALKSQKSTANSLAKMEKAGAKQQKALESKQAELEKYRARVAECEEAVAKLQADLEKNSGDNLQQAKDAAAAADQKVQELQAEIDRYRAVLMQ